MNTAILHDVLTVLRPFVGRSFPSDTIFMRANGQFQAEMVNDDHGLTWARVSYSCDYDGDLEISTRYQDTQLILESCNGDFTLEQLRPTFQDFPRWPCLTGGDTVTIPIAEFRKLETLLKSARNDDTRYNLNGIFLDRDNQTAVSTDGHRLSTFPVPWIPGLSWIPKGKGIILPAKALKRALASLKAMKCQGDVTLHFGGEYLWIRILETLEFCIKYLEGDYPQYQKLTVSHDHKAIFNRKEFQKALKLMRVMTTARNRGIALYLCPDGACLLSVHPDFGKGETWIPGTVDPELWGKLYAANCDYLRDAVPKTDKEITLEFGKSDEPLMVAGTLVMPMRDWKHGTPEMAADHTESTTEWTEPKTTDLFSLWEDWAA